MTTDHATRIAPAEVHAAVAPLLLAEPKITTRHLLRQALIYVRQSSPTQVQRHPESARRQYGLAARAQHLGWPVEQIVTIDDDQGKSAAGSAAAHQRDGFARLVSAVGLGEVGIVLALEVARLARNSAEWYRLLELAALAGVLIADEGTIYDPRAFNDRLLLGLRGTISEVELHCIQARLHGARMSKVRRGEFPLGLPIGYVRGGEGRVDLDPDQEVQGALRAIFAQFERLGSASAVLRFFNEHGLRIPRRYGKGPHPRPLVWIKPSYQAIHQVLSNPTYAGAYAYGQRRHDEEGPRGLGQPGPRRRFALDEVEVLLRDHHPAYIPWERYLDNRAVLRDNTARFTPSRGAPRAGLGLLQGIVFCGRCGCRMRPHYSPSSPGYVCRNRKQRYGEPSCQSLTIAHVDQAVSDAFLAVIRPAEVEASLALAEDLARDQAQVERQWQLRLERARYEADRAHRQYDVVEPENRLVARELERRWNDHLRVVAELEGEYRRERERGLSPLTEEDKAALRRLVGDVPALWHAAATTMEERKRLLRCLIHEVILQRDEVTKGAAGTTTIRIGWRSGAWTEIAARRPGSSEHLATPAPVLERIRTLAQHASDEHIAALLNADGLATRMGLPWTAQRVYHIRSYQGIPTACPLLAHGPAARGDGLVPLRTAAARLGVVPTALAHWWKWGFIQAEQHGDRSPLWVRLTDEDVARLDGTLAARGAGRWRMREAQRVLGLRKEQIWERARQGEVIAYRAYVGAHWEWRISPVSAPHPFISDGDTDSDPAYCLTEECNRCGVVASRDILPQMPHNGRIRSARTALCQDTDAIEPQRLTQGRRSRNGVQGAGPLVRRSRTGGMGRPPVPLTGPLSPRARGGSTPAPRGEKGRLTAITQVFYNTCVTVSQGVEMAVKQKRIKCARCGERETVMRGERGPASIYCDLCRDEVKRAQNALRAQAYRQRKASYGGVR